jgi:uncharacterized protein with GYD domain
MRSSPVPDDIASSSIRRCRDGAVNAAIRRERNRTSDPLSGQLGRRPIVPKFMVKASYGTDGIRGLMKDGGTGRRAAVQKLVEGSGGKLEAFYLPSGDVDADLPSAGPAAPAATAISPAVNAPGSVRDSTVPLTTPEDRDAACKKTVAYRAPGA